MKHAVTFLVAFVVVLGAALGAFYVTQSRPAQASGGGAALPQAQPAQRQFAIAMVMYGAEGKETHRWSGGTMVARVGDTITLKVKNADLDCPDDPHGFSLPAFNIDVPEIPAGQEKTFTFKADKPGLFDFKCAREKCALDHGEQTGQLLILP